MGKRKFELFTSAAHNAESPAPKFEGSFTRALNQALQKLIKEKENGFPTSDLFRELYHSVPKHLPRPQLFDQSGHDYGKIRLRPQNFTTVATAEIQPLSLNLTLRINAEFEEAIMYELARHLSFLPHVNEVILEKVYEPKKTFITFVKTTQCLSAFLGLRNKSLAHKKAAAVREGFREVLAPDLVVEPGKQMSENLTRKSPTWPLAQETICSHTKIVSGPILSAKTPGSEALGPGSLFERRCKRGYSEQEQAIGTVLAISYSIFHFDLHPTTLTAEQARQILLA